MTSNKITVSVIGAGKMGLPLACRFASMGANVIACDVNKATVDSINAGACPFDEPGLDAVLGDAVKNGTLRATTDTVAAVSGSQVVIVIVPVLLTEQNEADTTIIRMVTKDIARGMQKGTMVSYETTLPVGTTRSFAAILEESGLRAGEDFDLVFSPERVKSQLVLERLSENPKVVGGINERSAARAAEFYHKYLGAPIINVGSLEASELVKLAGMVYRDVNIALANEMARYADAVGVDIEAVIAAANTDGEGAILSPGIGVGGHCTPVYPYFLINDASRRSVASDLPSVSRIINDAQPAYMLDRIERVWKNLKGQDVLIMGIAFRPQVKETICSPAFQLRDELLKRGANVFLVDPLYNTSELNQFGFKAWESKNYPPVVILNTAHNQFRKIPLADFAAKGCQVFVDGRNIFSPEQAEESDLIYLGIGRSSVKAKGKVSPQRLPIIRPVLGAEESHAASAAIRSGWIMQGPRVELLEREFCTYTDASNACAVSSGTAALHLALLAVGVSPGDEVITVSHSFIATANSVRYCGAIPVFVDIEPGTFNIDPKKLEAAITKNTKAILCVHQMGMPCDLQEIAKIAAKHKLPVVEDAACAIGSEVLWKGNWQRIGRPHSNIACFSFHPRKLLTTGDGGMITTNDAKLDHFCRIMRNHGIDGGSHVKLGFNYRMTDIQAAIGSQQLKRLDSLIPRRRKQAQKYLELMNNISGLHLPVEPEWARSNWQSFCIRFDTGAERDRISQALNTAGIDTRSGIMCAHREPAYQLEPWRTAGETVESSRTSANLELTQSELCQDSGLILPLYDGLTDADLHRVVAAIKEAVSSVSPVR